MSTLVQNGDNTEKTKKNLSPVPVCDWSCVPESPTCCASSLYDPGEAQRSALVQAMAASTWSWWDNSKFATPTDEVTQVIQNC